MSKRRQRRSKARAQRAPISTLRRELSAYSHFVQTVSNDARTTLKRRLDALDRDAIIRDIEPVLASASPAKEEAVRAIVENHLRRARLSDQDIGKVVADAIATQILGAPDNVLEMKP